MEEVLKSISNPYSMENFEKIFDIFLNSGDYSEFYAKVVTYYQDRDTEGTVWEIKNNSKFTRTEYMNIWHVMRKFSDFFPTEHRIYINAPTNRIEELVSKFISECDMQKLPFELKYATEQIKRNDSIVIGSNTEVYGKHIEILRKIAKENPEIIEDCGTPPLLTGVLDGWMGLADENVANRYTSYTQSRLQAFTYGVNKFLYEHQDVASRIDANEILDIDRVFKSYEDIDKEELEEYLQDYLSDVNLSSNSKIKLAEYIKENPEGLKEIYKNFFIECERMGFDSISPLFYAGSIEQLLECEQDSKINITDEVRDKMENNSSTIIANMYLKEGRREKLSVESRVEIIEAIIGKELKDRKEEMLIYEDLEFLQKIGLIDDELMKEVEESLYSDDKIDLLEEYFENQVGAEYDDSDKKPLSLLLKKAGTSLTDEEMENYINERKQNIVEYFSRPQVVPEKKEQRIELEEQLLNSLTKERTVPYVTLSTLRTEVDLLKADVEDLPQKKEIRRKICLELQEKIVGESHIKKAQEITKPRKPTWDDWEL